ncbi:hypothetical protein ACIBEJ_00770 [Nonomuraea sp. NPDC050790]|uniref:hypothetical protein n=1 Tax=Nonomuraea sp. NPDC050790 TaxID=3364371 RepID=UPI003787342C
MKIPDDVLAVLTDGRTRIEGDRISIPFELDRSTYEQVNKLLKEAGGRWDGRKAVRAHVFKHDIEEMMRHALLAGEFTSGRDQGWFPTPPTIVEDLLTLAGISEKYAGLTVLEPSAGTGAIAGPAAARGAVVDCVELDPRRAAAVEAGGYARAVTCGDFLADISPRDYSEGFKRVVMNPPFSSAVQHVNHAIGFLADDALLVSVMPGSITWRNDRAHTELRALVHASGGEFTRLPIEAFRSSGVPCLETVIAVIPTGGGARLRNHSWHLAQPRQLHLFAA